MLAFNVIANLGQDSEKLLLLFGEELPLQSSDTCDPSPLVPSDNLPFNVTVIVKFSYNKDKIVHVKVNRNTLLSSSSAFRNVLNQIISKYLTTFIINVTAISPFLHCCDQYKIW